MIDSQELFYQLQIATNNTALSWPSDQNREFEIIRINKSQYGVGLPAAEDTEINERFASCRIQTLIIKKGNGGLGKEKIVMLSCNHPALIRHFANLALDFLNPENRQQIYSNPLSWWEEWTRMIGNTIRVKRPASLIAELLILKDLTEKGHEPKWGGSSQTIHDIEIPTGDIDVKSTLSHSENKITIHGEFQLSGEKPVTIAFCRLEQSGKGYSLNSLVQDLVSAGWDESYLTDELIRLGYEPGSSILNEKYQLIEKRYYLVDNDFPRIDKTSFAGGSIPAGISHINYTVSLDHLKYRDSF